MGRPKPKKPPRRKYDLTGKQRRFVEEYMLDLSAFQAALRAGYSSGSMGSTLLEHPLVQEEIRIRKEARRETFKITDVEVIQGLLKQANWYGKDASHQARINAYKLLGDHLGLFDKTINIDHKVTQQGQVQHQHTVSLGQMDLEKLRAMSPDQVKLMLEMVKNARDGISTPSPTNLIEVKPTLVESVSQQEKPHGQEEAPLPGGTSAGGDGLGGPLDPLGTGRSPTDVRLPCPGEALGGTDEVGVEKGQEPVHLPPSPETLG